MGAGHRWPEIARTYAEVNQLFGDIVKVTPSSKVVGDMALFLFSKGIKPADVLNLEPGSMAFPESVIDMMMGGLGWPDGGWPEGVWKVVLGQERYQKARAKYVAATSGKLGRKILDTALPAPIDLTKTRAELAEKFKRSESEDELYTHLI